jgi:hypothetical protein
VAWQNIGAIYPHRCVSDTEVLWAGYEPCVSHPIHGYAFAAGNSDHRNKDKGGRMPVGEEQVHDPLFQAFESEFGGVQVYEAALAYVRNDDLRGGGSTIWSTPSTPVTTSSSSKIRYEPSGSILSMRRPGARSSATPARRW